MRGIRQLSAKIALERAFEVELAQMTKAALKIAADALPEPEIDGIEVLSNPHSIVWLMAEPDRQKWH